MRFLALIALLGIIATGCVSFPQKTTKLYPGQTEKEVVAVLGAPVEVRDTEGKTRMFLYMPDHNGFSYPYYCQFKDDKLIGFGPDKEREQQARSNASVKAQQEAQANAALSQSMMNWSNQMNQQQQSQTPMKQIDLNCQNQCMAKGNMMQYCNSTCSY